MSNPNVNLSNLDARYSKPADVASAISTQATTDAGQYVAKGSIVINIKDAAYGAIGNGTADDAPAFRLAFTALGSNGGGTLVIPKGNYRCVATNANQFFSVPANTTLEGVRGASVISLDTDTASAYREAFRPFGDNIAFKGLTIQRLTDFPSVLVNIPAYKNFLLRDCTIIGNRDTLSTNYCHGTQYGQSSTTSNIMIDNCIFQTLSDTTLMTNSATGTVNGFTIRNSTMSNVDFNAPNGTVTDVLVQGCVVDGTATNGGYGVAFAHITRAVVRDCTIANFTTAGVHIEDFSADITVENNKFRSCATGASAEAYIQIISGVRQVKISNNTLDVTTNANSTSIYTIGVLQGGNGTTPGGRTPVAPQSISITGNMLIGGGTNNATSGIYLENTTNVLIANNQLYGAGAVNSGAYTGTLKSAINMYNNITTTLTGNIIAGWFNGINPYITTIQGLSYGGVISGNIFKSCYLGAGLVNGLPGVVSGNMFYNCITPMIAGNGSSTGAYPLAITGNHAYGCVRKFGIGSVVTVQVSSSATTQTVGSGKTLPIVYLDQYAPVGTVITFSGGGSLTLTTSAASGQTSLIGTVATASIAASETGTTILPYSSVGAQNMRLIENNADSVAGSAGYSGTLSGTTALRPAAAMVGSGAKYFDTTLSKPIWSTGSAWVDATGTSV